MEMTKHCPRCDQTKHFEDFNKDRNRSDGRFPWCRVCKRADNRKRYAGQPPRIAAHITDEELVKAIDMRFAPDGVGGFHWKYTGEGVNGEDSVPLLQRLSDIMDGRPLPIPVESWCRSEHPYCCNPDHLTSHGELVHLGSSELHDDFDGGGSHSGQSMQWLFAEANESSAHIIYRLDSLNGDWDRMPADVRHLENLGSEILREAGYNRWGQPYQRNNPQKGRFKKAD